MPAYFGKDDLFEQLLRFSFKYCRHVKGALVGQPVEFEKWLWDDLRLAYEIDKYGNRVFNQVVLSYPKKHSKSLTSTCVGAFELSPLRYAAGGPENYSVAGTKEQSRMTFDPMLAMLNPKNAAYSPYMAQLFRAYKNVIVCDYNGGKWEIVPHDATTFEGKNASFAAIDEYAVHKTQTMRDNVKSSMIARENPLMLTISTKGDNNDRPMYYLEQEMLKHENIRWESEFKWIVEDREAGVLYISCGLPEDYDKPYDDPEMWKQVNLASWITEKSLRQEWLDKSTTEASFRRKMLNQWVADAVEVGIRPEEWDACKDETIALVDGQEIFVMVDLAYSGDDSAVVWGGWSNDRFVVDCETWSPPGNGDEIDIRATVDKKVCELAEQFQVRLFGADPWNAKLLLQDWYYRRWQTHEMKMSPMIRVPASSVLLEMVQRREVAHNGNRKLREHVLNMIKRETDSGWLFDKANKHDRKKKIDAGIALIGCVFMAKTVPESTLNKYGLFI